MLALISRTFGSKDPVAIKTAFNVLVRPILEYACPVWNPYLVKHIHSIESIQRGATWLICGSDKSYYERLSELSWSTLELRRKYLCWVHLYKIIHGYSDVDCATYVDLTGPTRTRSNHDHDAKKIIFTACHLGKLKLAFTSPDIISTSPKNFLTGRIDFTVLLLFELTSKNVTCPSGKLKTEFTIPMAKSTSPRLSDTTFFACCDFKIRPRAARKNYFKLSFFNRYVNDWSSLPNSVLTASGLNSFKTPLLNYLNL